MKVPQLWGKWPLQNLGSVNSINLLEVCYDIVTLASDRQERSEIGADSVSCSQRVSVPYQGVQGEGDPEH